MDAASAPRIWWTAISRPSSGDAGLVSSLYADEPCHHGPIHRSGRIRYQGLLQTLSGQQLTDASFSITNKSGNAGTHHFSWTASGPTGTVSNGSDTFGTLDGKITYHYTAYTVIPK
jgi:hypothetical protein